MKRILSFIRGGLYRFRYNIFSNNVRIGRGLLVYKKMKIVGKGKVNIGEYCTVAGIPGDDSQYVTIDTHSDNAIINIGNNVGLYAARISSKYEITIGNNVLIEESSLIDTDFHSVDIGRGDPATENLETCRLNIGDNVSIGARSLILKGVTIGDKAIIVPGSIVSMSIQPGTRVLGNPARPVRA